MSTDSHVHQDEAGATGSPKIAWAFRHPMSHVRLWIAAVGGLGLDLWSKEWAFSTLKWNESRTIVESFLGFHLSLNPGALFGLGDGFAPIFVGASVLALIFVLYLFANSSAKQWSLHLALGLVLAGAVGNLYDRTTQEACVVRLEGPQGSRRAIGTLQSADGESVTIVDYGTRDRNPRTWPIAGGSTGDRKRLEIVEYGPQPVVRDFIKFEVKIAGREIYPWIFNVADAMLVVGVGILLMNFWRERKHREPAEGA
ncbi:MAG: signal peptidase II [Planctomycetota bacterium]|nr:signal peptidase II [Planctomycetota bacterium]